MTSVGSKLNVTRVAGSGGWLYRLEGHIDDTLDAARLSEGASGIVVLDLGGIERITSSGVRRWMMALRSLPADSYYFINCPPVIVTQFNLIAKFGCAGTLVSFHAPYACTACGKAFDVPIDLRRQHAEISQMQAPAARCPACSGEAELDDLPDSFFAFAAAQPAPHVPRQAAAIIDRDPAAVAFKVEKEIDEELTILTLHGGIEKSAQFRRLGEGLDGKVLLILSGVTQIGADGHAGLCAFTRTPQTEIYVARPPLALLPVIAGFPDKLGAASLCALDLPYRCAACGDQPVKAIGNELAPWAEITAPPARECPGCGAALQAQFGAAELVALRTLGYREPPPEIASRLSGEAAPASLEPPRPEPTAAAAAPTGAILGKYEVVKRLGAGGMAEVFLADHKGPMGFTKRVVLKRILPHLATERTFVDMFLQEARLAASISHPNVVQIFDLGDLGTDFFIAMEYVPGWDLKHILRAAMSAGKPLPVSLACRIVADVCNGLHAAHTTLDDQGNAQPIVHRDVTPQNVLVSKQGLIKLTDFGIAKATNSSGMTQPGTIKGTIAYLAPELIFGQAAHPRVDVYSAGLILYECLLNEHPFVRDAEAATLHAIIEGKYAPPSSRRPDVPPLLEVLLGQALATDPEKRLQTADAFANGLEQVLAKLPDERRTSAHLAAWVKENLTVALATSTRSRLEQAASSTQVKTSAATPAKAVRTAGD